MSTLTDLTTSLGINAVLSVGLVCAFAVLKNQPMNVRVYYSKWQVKGEDVGPAPIVNKYRGLGRYINLNIRSYFHVMDWTRECLRMPEAELIEHAGLDSVVFLRIIRLGLKLFIPIMVIGFVVLVPLNVTDKHLMLKQEANPNFTYDSLDTITISNIQNASQRLWAHLLAAYVYTLWAFWLLFNEYRSIIFLRFAFLASQEARPDQFTILCRCIPEDHDETVAVHVDHFFRVNHPDYYLLSQHPFVRKNKQLAFRLPTFQMWQCAQMLGVGHRGHETVVVQLIILSWTARSVLLLEEYNRKVVYDANALSKLVKRRAELQNKVIYLQGLLAKKLTTTRPTVRTGFLGLFGEKVDQLDYTIDTIDQLTDEINKERKRVLSDEKSVMPAAFVSFETRWGAAVCSQTRQSKDASKWLTEWAPEPRDIYWANLPIPYNVLNSRRLGMQVLVFLLIFFYMVPIASLQVLANLEQLEKTFPFLRPVVEAGFMKSVIQGFLPGLILRVFLLALPYILRVMTKFEGYVSYSTIEKYSAVKYLGFMVVNVFIGNIIIGSVFEQLKQFIEKPTQIPMIFGLAIPMKATFFITYIMVDGWTGCALKLVRLLPLFLYHFRNTTMVRTDRDRDRATPVGTIELNVALPQLGLYFLLGLVYAIISPLLLPFVIIFLGASYVVTRHQIINCYEQKYESAAAYWPHMFGYITVGMLINHVTLIGVMSLKEAASSTPFLLPLPICTIIFYFYCRNRFQEAFRSYALEEAKAKDTIERVNNPNLNVRSFLENVYTHPVLRSSITGQELETDSDDAVDELLNRNLPPRRLSRGSSGETQGSRGSHGGSAPKKLPEDSEADPKTVEGIELENEHPADSDAASQRKLLGHVEP